MLRLFFLIHASSISYKALPSKIGWLSLFFWFSLDGFIGASFYLKYDLFLFIICQFGSLCHILIEKFIRLAKRKIMDHQENAPNTPMTDLDQMVSDDQIQILKAAIPYVSSSGQRLLSVYSKMRELQNTLTLFPQENSQMRICGTDAQMQPMDLLNEIRPFCSGQTQERIDQIIQMFAMLQMIELFQEQD